jgi:metal-sulfur cluster biosynthetic enzyme
VPDAEALRQRALAALADVVDPELGLGIVDLGLVRELRIDGDALTVVLTPTSAACPMTDLIADGAQAALDRARLEIPATLELRWEPPWSPAWMSERARRVLGG